MRTAQHRAIDLADRLANLSDADLAAEAKALMLEMAITSPSKFSPEARRLKAMRAEAFSRQKRLSKAGGE